MRIREITLCMILGAAMIGCSDANGETAGEWWQADTASAGMQSSPEATKDASRTGSEDEEAPATDAKPRAAPAAGGRVSVEKYAPVITGIGCWLRNRKDGVEVFRLIPSAPAHKAGMREGDVIVQVDDWSADGQGYSAVFDKIGDDLKVPRTIHYVRKNVRHKTTLTVDRHRRWNIGYYTAWARRAPALDLADLERLPKRVIRMALEGKFKATGVLLDSVRYENSANPQFHLADGFNALAQLDLIGRDCMSVDKEALAKVSELDAALKKIDAATELDDGLKQTTARLLSWLVTDRLRRAANAKRSLNQVRADFDLQLEADPYAYNVGGWVIVNRRVNALDAIGQRDWVGGFAGARDTYDRNGDFASATFLEEVIAYKCCPSQDYALASLRYLHSRIEKADDAKSIRTLAATVAALAVAHRERLQKMANADELILSTFALLREKDVVGYGAVLRHLNSTLTEEFNRLATPREAFLYQVFAVFLKKPKQFLASLTPDARRGVPRRALAVMKDEMQSRFLVMSLAAAGYTSESLPYLARVRTVPAKTGTWLITQSPEYLGVLGHMIGEASGLGTADQHIGSSAARKAGVAGHVVMAVVTKGENGRYFVKQSGALRVLRKMG